MESWRKQANSIFQLYEIPATEHARLIQEATNLEAYLQRLNLAAVLKGSTFSLGVRGDYRVSLEQDGLWHKHRNTLKASRTNCLVAVIFFHNNSKQDSIVEWLAQKLGQ